MSPKVLITGAEGDIAEAICRILREAVAGAVVHGADVTGDSWPTWAGFATVHRLPRGDAPGYVAALAELQGRERFDIVIPATDAELGAIAAAPPAGVPLLMAPAHLVRVWLDKLETARWLCAHEIPAPATVPLEEAGPGHVPCVVKPRRGHGSRGMEVVHSAARLAALQQEPLGGRVAQELLSDASQEFTCALFRVGQAESLRTIVFRRVLVGGLTGRARVEEVPPITELLTRVAEAAALTGSINVQLRLTDAGPRIFEINPRFSSTVMMRHRLGFQDVVWALNHFATGQAPPPYTAPVGTRIFRLAREVVVPVAASA